MGRGGGPVHADQGMVEPRPAMSRARRFAAWTTAVLVAGSLPAGAGQAAGPGAPSGNPVRLQVGTVLPAVGARPELPPRLTRNGVDPDNRATDYIVQFRGPVERAWKTEVTRLGGRFLSYLPDFAFKVRMTPPESRQVSSLATVAAVRPFHPGYKVSPDLVRRPGGGLYTVRLERGADPSDAAAAIEQAGARVVGAPGRTLQVAATPSQVDVIAGLLDVEWVEDLRIPEKHDEFGGGLTMGSSAANALGFDGSTQTVAVADTGLGGGTAATAHQDIPATRIAGIANWPGTDNACYDVEDDGARDVDSGHGTHVAGSAVGAGRPAGEGRGTAPGARLFFQAIESWVTTRGVCSFLPSGYQLAGLPSDLALLFQQAYDAGARVHANSWGSAVAGEYTSDSAAVDDFAWRRRDLTIAFSAGNEGADAAADGEVDRDSLGSPATAKNPITVGASENDRQGNWQCDVALTYPDETGKSCADLGGMNAIFNWAGGGFSAEPLASDPTAGNAEQMAGFSSRGPSNDGRIKPDVVAPGTWILSAYSDLYQPGYDATPNPRNNGRQFDGYGFPRSQHYKYMSGTSMANPLVAGAAAVVRDFYRKAREHEASAALVKATLINSAQDLLDENNDGADDNDHAIPNAHEGWGRVDLDGAVDGSRGVVDETSGMTTGAEAEHRFAVASGEPFKATVAWTDSPSTSTAARNLVNDLDLEVVAPDGTVYRGNVFSGGWSAAGGSPDRVNNVENVYVQSAAAGVWSVRVRAFNVPDGPQPFALVVEAAGPPPDTEAPDTEITSGPQGPTPDSTPTFEFAAGEDEVSFDCRVDGGDWFACSSPYTAPELQDGEQGDHTFEVRATDRAGNTDATPAARAFVVTAPARLVAEPATVQLQGLLRLRIAPAATLTHARTGQPVAGRGVSFTTASGSAICTARTDARGVAGCAALLPTLLTIVNLGYDASFPGDGRFQAARAHGRLVSSGSP